MCQNNYNIDEKKGKHLKWEDRKIIEHLYNHQNKSPEEIAQELGKHRSTEVQ